MVLGLPRGLSGKESTCRCRRHEVGTGLGRPPHATEQLKLTHHTTEPVPWSLGAASQEPVHPRARATQQAEPLQ